MNSSVMENLSDGLTGRGGGRAQDATGDGAGVVRLEGKRLWWPALEEALNKNSKLQKAAIGRNRGQALCLPFSLHTQCLQLAIPILLGVRGLKCDPETNLGYRAGQNKKIWTSVDKSNKMYLAQHLSEVPQTSHLGPQPPQNGHRKRYLIAKWPPPRMLHERTL